MYFVYVFVFNLHSWHPLASDIAFSSEQIPLPASHSWLRNSVKPLPLTYHSVIHWLLCYVACVNPSLPPPLPHHNFQLKNSSCVFAWLKNGAKNECLSLEARMGSRVNITFHHSWPVVLLCTHTTLV